MGSKIVGLYCIDIVIVLLFNLPNMGNSNIGNLVTHANGYHVPNKRSVTMTLQPGEEISNALAPGAMTPLQPLAQKRLETHFFDQCHGCYGWVGSDVVKEFQGIFVLPIADVARQCLCAKVSGVRHIAKPCRIKMGNGTSRSSNSHSPSLSCHESNCTLSGPQSGGTTCHKIIPTPQDWRRRILYNDIKSRQKLPRKWQKLMPRFSVDFVRSKKVRGMRSYVDQFEMSH